MKAETVPPPARVGTAPPLAKTPLATGPATVVAPILAPAATVATAAVKVVAPPASSTRVIAAVPLLAWSTLGLVAAVMRAEMKGVP